MVIPTPSQPRLGEMPREFFQALATFTTRRPTPRGRYRVPRFSGGGFGGAGFPGGAFGGFGGAVGDLNSVQVLETGIVGTLDYKIIRADSPQDLFLWLRENNYSYSGDEPTLRYYIDRRWYFTVMKIDPLQQPSRADGNFEGQITPTRFTFYSERLIYPLRITQISVPDRTDAVFYVRMAQKADLPVPWSYEYRWAPRWRRSLDLLLPGRMTAQEWEWKAVVDDLLPDIRWEEEEIRRRDPQWQPSQLEWAGKIRARDLAMVDGSVRFDGTATAEETPRLRLLRGHLRAGEWLTRIRKTFRRSEMVADMTFVPAKLAYEVDEMEYRHQLPN